MSTTSWTTATTRSSEATILPALATRAKTGRLRPYHLCRQGRRVRQVACCSAPEHTLLPLSSVWPGGSSRTVMLTAPFRARQGYIVWRSPCRAVGCFLRRASRTWAPSCNWGPRSPSYLGVGRERPATFEHHARPTQVGRKAALVAASAGGHPSAISTTTDIIRYGPNHAAHRTSPASGRLP